MARPMLGSPSTRGLLLALAYLTLSTIVVGQKTADAPAAVRSSPAPVAAGAAAAPAAAAAATAKAASIAPANLDQATAEQLDALEQQMIALRRKRRAQQAQDDAADWRLTESEARAAGLPPSAVGKIRICVSPSTPYNLCTINGSTVPSDFTGVEVELFREVALRVPWLRDPGAYVLQCLNYQTMMRDLDSPRNGTCLLGMAGIASSTKDAGKSSQSYGEKGALILVNAKRDSSKANLFSPFYAFTWQLWIVLLGTSIGVGAILWLFDCFARAIYYDHQDDVPPARSASSQDAAGKAKRVATGKPAKLDSTDQQTADAMAFAVGADDAELGLRMRSQKFRSFLAMAHDNEHTAVKELDKTLRAMLLNLAKTSSAPNFQSLPSQIVLWAWGILSMIVISQYTGATAAGLTTAELNGGIHTLADLRGHRVAVLTEYVPRLSAAGIVAVPVTWAEGVRDEDAMLAQLRSGAVDAIVMDSNFVSFQAGTQCDLVATGKLWAQKLIGFRFGVRVQQPLIDGINAAILDAKEDGVTEYLKEKFVTNPSQSCTRRKAMSKSTTVAFVQVAGLWVMLGISMLAGVSVLLFMWCSRRTRKVVGRSASELTLKIKERRRAKRERSGIQVRPGGEELTI